jgi:DNA-binding transcriptional ArsR family regulator
MAYESAIQVLADQTRRKLFERIAERPQSVNELAKGLSVSRPAVSQHLKALRDADLVRFRQEGTRRVYSARTEALGELRSYIDLLWHDVLEQYRDTGGEK